jgi:hypothetical protein
MASMVLSISLFSCMGFSLARYCNPDDPRRATGTFYWQANTIFAKMSFFNGC